MAVPAFKAVWGAIVLSLVGSIPTPSAFDQGHMTTLIRPTNILETPFLTLSVLSLHMLGLHSLLS